ncbi:MAG: tetratricopeptide repeat protein [Blastocatellia bacterium]
MRHLSRIVLPSLFLFVLLAGTVMENRAATQETPFAQGMNFFALGQYQMALRHFRFALADAQGAQTALVHYNIGVCHFRLGDARQAVREYETALALRNQRYAMAALALGHARLELGDPAARGAFAGAVETAGREDHNLKAEALFEIAMLLTSAGEHDQAITHLRRAIAERDARFPAAHNNLGILLALRGDGQAAEQAFSLALKFSNGRMTQAAHNLRLCRAQSTDIDRRRLIAQWQPASQPGAATAAAH